MYSIQLLSNLCADNIHNCKTTRQNMRKSALSENRLLKNFSNTYVSLILYYQSGNFLLNCFWYVGIQVLVRHFNKNTFWKSRAEKKGKSYGYEKIIIKNNMNNSYRLC